LQQFQKELKLAEKNLQLKEKEIKSKRKLPLTPRLNCLRNGKLEIGLFLIMQRLEFVFTKIKGSSLLILIQLFMIFKIYCF
jgi:hypothetical protein